MRKFVEDDIELSFKTPLHFTKSVVCMVLTAPYRLVMTLSAKAIYLPQKALVKVLLNSVIVAGAVTACNAGYQIYTNQFSLFKGKFPMVVMIATVFVLILCYFLVSFGDYTVHTQLSELMPEESEDSVMVNTEDLTEEELVNYDLADESVPADESATSDESKTVNVSDLNWDTLNAIDLTKQAEELKGSFGKTIEDSKLQQLLNDMEEAAKTSPYVSERLLARFIEDQIIEDQENLDSISIGLIPNDFRVIA